MASVSESDPFIEQDSEDDFDWEEVQVPEHQEQEQQQEQQHIEITIPVASGSRSKKTQATSKSVSTPDSMARLLSLTPLSLQNAFSLIHKSRVPDQNQRGRMFENAVANLAGWWSGTYFEITPYGHIKNRTYDDVQAKLAKLGPPPTNPDAILDTEDVEDLLGDAPERIRSSKSLMKHALMASGSRDVSAQLFTALCRGLGIPARLVVSLQSVPWQTHVGKPKPTYTKKQKGDKGKGKATEDGAEGDEEDGTIDTPVSVSRSGSETPNRSAAFPGAGQRLNDTPIQKSEKAKGKEKANPVITLKKTKSKGRALGSASESSTTGPTAPDPRTTPPVFWTEVFSRPDGRWIPVDPIRSIVNKRKVFDPTPTLAPTPTTHSALFPQSYAAALDRRATVNNASKYVRQENRMVYVVALEEDGYARDVTRRYAKEFSAKIAKVQGGSSTIGGGRKARVAWWEGIMGAITRPYRLNRDDVEDEELDAAQITEGMPTTISGFKDHPIYILKRHLKQNQIIHPPDTSELGKFRGEAVYPRSALVSLKAAENWMRSEGRMISEGSQPLKMVKIRAGTINRLRELEVRKDELLEAGDSGGTIGDTMQGLYARSQTEPYQPDPVVNGKVPKNNFGNIDLYVPSMLPRGAAHVPFKGVAKIAKKLGFDFAEAVTGFEFKKRRAFPVIEGVVVAQENEPALLEAYWEAEQDAEDKARAKREDRVLKQWTRLIEGLRIRKRLQNQYATKPDTERQSQVQGVTHDAAVENQLGISKDIVVTMSHPGVGAGGGFLVGADDVVQPFHLPKPKFQPLEVRTQPEKNPLHDAELPEPEPGNFHSPAPNDGTFDLETIPLDSDVHMEYAGVNLDDFLSPEQNRHGHVPKTMRELAEAAAQQTAQVAGRSQNGNNYSENEIDDDVARDPYSAGQVTDVVGRTLEKPTRRALRVSLKLSSDSTTPSGALTLPAKAGKATSHSASIRRSQRSKKRPRGGDSDDVTDGDDLSEPAPKKRASRLGQKSEATTPVSTRTLRPRRSKTTTQLREENEREEAYRRAVDFADSD
ncbi:hypothetical protein H0H92_003477 [Tricholoma furcatifolium]|nr:hypothetical protein H0H92_003477 [Tricholoma furcatifolium]